MPLGKSEGGKLICAFFLALSLVVSPEAEREERRRWRRGKASEQGLHRGRGLIAAEGDGGLYQYKCILLQHLTIPRTILVIRQPEHVPSQILCGKFMRPVIAL
jgi:hypothetical protein